MHNKYIKYFSIRRGLGQTKMKDQLRVKTRVPVGGGGGGWSSRGLDFFPNLTFF